MVEKFFRQALLQKITTKFVSRTLELRMVNYELRMIRK